MKKMLEKKIAIRKSIKESSPFCKEETERILKKFFNKVPNSTKILVEKYDFDRKKVLEIGCMYGQTLLYWGGTSEGVDIYEPAVKFLRSLGRRVNVFNVEDGFDKLKDKQYEAVYCSNVIEHLIAPHLFLARLHTLLKPQGILAIGVPVMPVFFSCLWKAFGIRGWLAKEHINFFTFKTAKLTLGRAGFEVLEQWSPGLYKFSRPLSRISAGLMPHYLFVCRKIENFTYGTARKSSLNPSWAIDLEGFL